MYIGMYKVQIHIPESHSLKQKRKTVQSIAQKLRNTFPVSVAETADQEKWQIATIGVCFVSHEGRQAQTLLDKIANFVANHQSNYLLLHENQQVMGGL